MNAFGNHFLICFDSVPQNILSLIVHFLKGFSGEICYNTLCSVIERTNFYLKLSQQHQIALDMIIVDLFFRN